jgi:hypothetical protein
VDLREERPEPLDVRRHVSGGGLIVAAAGEPVQEGLAAGHKVDSHLLGGGGRRGASGVGVGGRRGQGYLADSPRRRWLQQGHAQHRELGLPCAKQGPAPLRLEQRPARRHACKR